MTEKENPLRVLMRRTKLFGKFLLSGIKVTSLRPYWHNREISRVLFLSAVINLSMWAYLFHSRGIKSDYPIILHYNLFIGVDALGDYEKVFLLPLAGLVLFLLNALLAQFFYKIERLASYMLTMNIFIIQIVLILASYLIVRVNS